jgi:hypothetical protein
MSLPRRHERSATRDQWVVACEPNNPEVVGPWVWSWHQWRFAALRACGRMNTESGSGRRYYVLSRAELDARWKRFL